MVEEGFYYTAGKVRNVPVTIGGTYMETRVAYRKYNKRRIE